MTDYAVRLIQVVNGWHWYAGDGRDMRSEGRSSTLWDAVNDAYRSMKEDLNQDGGTQW